MYSPTPDTRGRIDDKRNPTIYSPPAILRYVDRASDEERRSISGARWRYMLLTIERGTGICPIKNRLKMLRTERISDEQAKTLADRFGVLVEVLLKALATPESL